MGLVMANDDMVKFINELKRVEGNASLSKNIHPKTKSKYGAYYDDVNNLTTGTGDLVYKYDRKKTEKKNKELEEKAILKWKKDTGYDPFNLKEEQSNDLLRKRINSRIPEIKKKIKIWDSVSSDTRTNLLSSWFRGSLPKSKNTLGYLNSGNFEAASKEFLNHGEYRRRKAALANRRKTNPKARDGVVERMEKTSKSILSNKEESNKSIMGPLQNLQLNRGPASIEPPQTMGIQTMEKRPNEEVISKDATVRKKIAQQAESVMPGSGKEIEDKQSWENLKNDEETGKVLSPMQNFMKGMSHFTPELIAGSLGGWATGPQAAAKMMEPLRKGGEDSLAERRLQLTEGNLALRLEEIKEQRKRTSNLEEDRTLRREKAATQRALNQQNFFIKRKDIAKIIESKDVLNEMDDLIENAKTIAPGVIPFKIAKGIANEVGNLSETEIAKSEISQDWWSKIKRKGNVVLTGELPEGDVENLRKATTLLRKKKNERLKTKADQFIKGSKLYVDPDLVKQSTYDRLGLEVEEKSSAIESAAKKYGLEL